MGIIGNLRFTAGEGNYLGIIVEMGITEEELQGADYRKGNFRRDIFIFVESQCVEGIGVRANIHLGGQTEFCPNGKKTCLSRGPAREKK